MANRITDEATKGFEPEMQTKLTQAATSGPMNIAAVVRQSKSLIHKTIDEECARIKALTGVTVTDVNVSFIDSHTMGGGASHSVRNIEMSFTIE